MHCVLKATLGKYQHHNELPTCGSTSCSHASMSYQAFYLIQYIMLFNTLIDYWVCTCTASRPLSVNKGEYLTFCEDFKKGLYKSYYTLIYLQLIQKKYKIKLVTFKIKERVRIDMVNILFDKIILFIHLLKPNNSHTLSQNLFWSWYENE